MAYGCAGGGGEGGGTNDHRLLAGRTDANQHPASAVAVSPIALIGADADTVQKALARLAERGGAEEIAPTAAVSVGGYKAVAFRADGRVEPADHDTPAHLFRIAGVTLAAVEAGAQARVCVDGPVHFNGWNWSPGAPVFVGHAGDLTQTPPATGFVQHIGFATDSAAILVQIERPIKRN